MQSRKLRLAEALFDAVLAGWRRQGVGRHLSVATLKSRESIVRRFQAATELWPWSGGRFMLMSGWRI